MDILVGRKTEQAKLQACLESGRSEFVVVYGRRRKNTQIDLVIERADVDDEVVLDDLFV